MKSNDIPKEANRPLTSNKGVAMTLKVEGSGNHGVGVRYELWISVLATVSFP